MAGLLRHWIVAASFAVICARIAPGFASDVSEPRPQGVAEKVEAALAEKTELHVNRSSLADFAALIKRRHGIEIQLDHRALGDEGLASDTLISCDLGGISLRSVLRLVLSELDATFVVRNEVLLFTTKTEAENLEVVRLWPVEDLVIASDEFMADERGRAPGKGLRKFAELASLIDLISSMVSPSLWDAVGGPGQIQELPDGRTLAVCHLQEVHEEIAQLLAALRAVRDEQRKWGLFLAKRAGDAPVADPNALTSRVYLFPPPRNPAYRLAGDAPRAAPADWDKKRVRRLAQQISAEIEPQNWHANGGAGTIAAVSGALLVRQTPEMHGHIADLLRGVATFRSFQRPRLAPEGPRVDWPQQAEPRPIGARAAIEQALEDCGRIDFARLKLNQIAERLEQRYSIEVHLNLRTLRDEGVDLEKRFTLRCDGMPLRETLRLMLEPAELSYAICNEALVITTQSDAEYLLSTKVYPVLDLAVRPTGESPARPTLDYESLVELISATVAPISWDGVGGPGAIQAFPNCGALVVSQTDEIHREIAELLDSLRCASVRRRESKMSFAAETRGGFGAD